MTLAAMKTVATTLAGLSGLAIAAFLHGADPEHSAPVMRQVEMPGSTRLLVASREVTRRERRDRCTGKLPTEPLYLGLIRGGRRRRQLERWIRD